MKYAGISFVAAKKLILNVSKIRLRLIFSRASDIPRLFQKAYGKLYTTCGYWESSTYHFRHGCRWFSTGASSQCELVVKQLYRDVQLLNSLFQKAYGKCVFKSGGGVCIYFVLHKINTRRFRSGMDAAGSTQKRVCLQTRSPK